ncbi:MAG: hypothetical protein GKR88_07200 [Flavobacteriaceae bacterium]|nr:MAG: hypothetical protein GKR88_07200 [Flavobacteriaceae bacterium]
MTIITIKDSGKIKKTAFASFEELAEFLFEKFGYGTLLPLDETELTNSQKKRMEKALKTPKSDMLNL